MIKKSLTLAIISLLVLSVFLSACCGDNKSDEGPGGPADVDTTPPVISDLTDAEVTATTARITWTTDEPATSQVEYGITDAYGSETSLDTQLSTTHSVTLENLAQDTEYYFRAKSRDEADNESVSADKDFTTELAQPDFSTSDLSLSHDKITVWQQVDVTATAKVTNAGEADGTYTAIWKVDGDEVERKELDIAAGATEEITMTLEIMRTAGPDCEIEIGGETAILTVEEGVLTPLSMGDSWTFEATFPTRLGTTIEVEVTAEVIGEEPVDENDCYVLELSTEDSKFTEFDGAVYIDKVNMLPVKMDVEGEYALVSYHFEAHGTYSFRIIDGGERFPLVVGKELKVEEELNVYGTEYPEPLETTTRYIYRVEAIEDVGIFRCFKIVKYDEAGETEIGTGWMSDEVKQWPVKTDFDGSSGDLWATTELVSYEFPSAA